LQRFRRVEVGYELSAGTPLFDHEGVLTGIAARRSAEMIIVPISAIRSLLPDVFSQEAVPTDALRIQYLMMPDVLPLNLADDPQAPQRGAYIVSVERLSSGAVLPSLERGDIIIAVNEQPLTSSEDLSLAFAKFRPQKEALLTVYRDAQQIRVPVVLSVAQ
jgi:S1-C subfamily serine protease